MKIPVEQLAKKEIRIFKHNLGQRMQNWIDGMQGGPDVPGIPNDVWLESDILVVFPRTLSPKERHVVHSLCAKMELYHMSLGEGGDRFICVSRDGNFSSVLPPVQSDAKTCTLLHVGQSCVWFDQFVCKPKVKPAYFNGQLSTEKRLQLQSLLRGIANGIGFHSDILVPLLPEGLHQGSTGFMSPRTDLTQHWTLVNLEACQPLAIPSASGTSATGLKWCNTRGVHLVETEERLVQLAAHLLSQQVIGFDCEMHSFRSFYPITCLIQLSTMEADYIVDTLALWYSVGPVLGPVFACPRLIKVGHGIVGMDVPCLFRDFGIVLISCFDTQDAAAALGMKQKGLSALLERWGCPVTEEVAESKERMRYMDWRVRPLTPSMCRYAALDAHYLVPLFGLMTRALVELATDVTEPAASVQELLQFSKSKDIKRKKKVFSGEFSRKLNGTKSKCGDYMMRKSLDKSNEMTSQQIEQNSYASDRNLANEQIVVCDDGGGDDGVECDRETNELNSGTQVTGTDTVLDEYDYDKDAVVFNAATLSDDDDDHVELDERSESVTDCRASTQAVNVDTTALDGTNFDGEVSEDEGDMWDGWGELSPSNTHTQTTTITKLVVDTQIEQNISFEYFENVPNTISIERVTNSEVVVENNSSHTVQDITSTQFHQNLTNTLNVEQLMILNSLQARILQDKIDLAELNKFAIHPTLTLLRYLRANMFDSERTLEHMKRNVVWRRENDINEIWKRSPEDVIGCPISFLMTMYPNWQYKYDNAGRPVVYKQYTTLDCTKLKTSLCGFHKLMLYHAWGMEQCMKLCTEESIKRQSVIDTVTIVLDLDAMSMSQLSGDFIELIQVMSEIDSKQYPETIGYFFIINAPTIFPFAWRMVRGFLDPLIATKIKVFGTRDTWESVLIEVIGRDNLPMKYGGSNEDLSTSVHPYQAALTRLGVLPVVENLSTVLMTGSNSSSSSDLNNHGSSSQGRSYQLSVPTARRASFEDGEMTATPLSAMGTWRVVDTANSIDTPTMNPSSAVFQPDTLISPEQPVAENIAASAISDSQIVSGNSIYVANTKTRRTRHEDSFCWRIGAVAVAILAFCVFVSFLRISLFSTSLSNLAAVSRRNDAITCQGGTADACSSYSSKFEHKAVENTTQPLFSSKVKRVSRASVKQNPSLTTFGKCAIIAVAALLFVGAASDAIRVCVLGLPALILVPGKDEVGYDELPALGKVETDDTLVTEAAKEELVLNRANDCDTGAHRDNTAKSSRASDLFIPGSYVTADNLLIDSRLCELRAVLTATAHTCASLWTPSPPMAATKAYKSVSGFRERANSKRRPWTARTVFVFQELVAWRDREARIRDESPGYICPASLLLDAADRLPTTIQELLILTCPLPHSMREGSNNASSTISCADSTSHVGPVDLPAAVSAALDVWNSSHTDDSKALQPI